MGSRLDNKSAQVRKQIENHTFDNEEGEEYEASKFGGFPDYFRRKKLKLQNLDAELRAQSGDKPQIFRGIVAHINGYTQPSLNDLHAMLVTHGAGFVQYLDGKTMVTHIIASSLTPKKAVEFKRYRIVKPAWIVDSVKAGRLLPWDSYRVIDEGVAQKVLAFNQGQMVSQVNGRTKGYKEQTDASWYTSQLQTEPPPGGQASPEDFDENPPAIMTSPQSSPDPPINPIVQTGSRGIKRTRTSRSPSPRKAAKLTAEEHNSILLADPRIRKSTVVNPDFLEQYYRESRLHHLSTWKAELKSQLQSLTDDKSFSRKANLKRKAGSRRYVMHVDFDSFFAAVSLRKCPEYKDKPAAVAHGPGSGSEIASCNYPARKFGITNGMWMKKAQELCPDLRVLPYDFPAYEEASRKFYDVILATGGIVQSVSIDEALVDISNQCISASDSDSVDRSEGSIHREQSKADAIAKQLRDDVFDLTGCNVSVGLGGNILQAKLALRKAKPAGQYQLKPEDVLEFIGNLQVQSLPGVAYSIAGKLEEIGVKLVKDIRDTSKERLVRALGPKTGEKVYEYARGIDKSEVGDQVIRKSVSAEVNWGVRFENQDQVDEFIQSLCGELRRRLVKENVKGQQLTLKVMRRSPDAPIDPPKHLGHGKCDTYNKSLQLGIATNDAEVIAKEALAAMRGFGFTPGELRGIGVQMTKLEPLKTAAVDGRQADGSQKRLQFKVPEPPETKPAAADDPITDDVKTPKKIRVRDAYQPMTPLNAKMVGSPSGRPLNTLGTQFVLPSQIDPKVLAELPDDIRSKLMRQMDPSRVPGGAGFRETSPSLRSSPKPPTRIQSPVTEKLDEDFLESLPEDIRAEVRAMYRTSPRKPGAQSVLPQSPRKNRVAPPFKKPVSRKRGGGLFSRNNLQSRSSGPTLTQANFVARMPASDPFDSNTTDVDSENGIPDLDDSFLQGLPEDLREEVLEQYRADQLRRTGGIEVSVQAKKRLRQKQKAQQRPLENSIESYLLPPPRKQRPKFMKKYSELEDLRRVIKLWVGEFSKENPYDEDIDALVSYLTDVVMDERDLDKAVKVVKWLAWVVGEEVDGSDDSSFESVDSQRTGWSEAVLKVQNGVQDAVTRRGLGQVDFG